MPLLVQVTIGATTRKVSDEPVRIESQYLPLVMEFDPPQLNLTDISGGWCRPVFGAIAFSPDLFSSDWPVCKTETSTDWPPAETVGLTIQYTESTEAAAVTICSGTGYLTLVDRTKVSYDIFADDIDLPLLDEEIDYNNEVVALPRAFGEVVYETPIRLSDYVGYACYHMAGITGTRARTVSSLWDDGVGKCYVESSLHGFSVGDQITLEGTDSDGVWTVTEVLDIFTFRCDAPFVSDGSGHVYKAGYWRVYIDGVPASSTCFEVGDGARCYFDPAPTGQVTISGTGVTGTLDGAADWCCNRLGLTYDGSDKRAVQPEIGHWETSQQTTLEFLGGVCATLTHMFWVDGSTLRLIDMDAATAEATLTEYEYFSVEYERQTPPAVVTANVTSRRAIEDDRGKSVLEIQQNVSVVSRYKYGDEVTIDPYHWKREKARDAIRRVIGYHTLQRVSLSMPITADLPTPGQKISFADDSLKAATDCYVFVRGLSYDFAGGRVNVDGDGSLGAPVEYAVPRGLIVAWSGSEIPEGWSPVGGDAMGKYLIGAGGALDPGAFGGFDGAVGTSSTDGAHTGTSYTDWLQSTGSDLEYGLIAAATASAGGHAHQVFCGYMPAYQNVRLLQAQYPMKQLPADAIVFSKSNTPPTGLTAFVTSGRYLRAAADTDTDAEVTSVAVVEPAGAHAHGTQGQYASSGSYTNNYRYEKAPDHVHTLSGSFTTDIKRAHVRSWTKASAYDVPDDIIAMFDSLDIPDGWALYDGSGGMADLRDRFIVLAADGTTADAGDNTADLSYSLASVSHEHQGTVVSTAYAKVPGYHAATQSHTHTLAATVDYKPPFYAMVFIKYVG